MARRRKAQRRRRSSAVSLLNVAESYAYANILTSGLMGTTPVGFITGEKDLLTGWRKVSATGMVDSGNFTMQAYVDNPDEMISLSDIVSSPDAAFGIVSNNFKSNYQQMALNSIFTGISFRVGKRLLRRPISNVNRNIFKPLGAGFKL